MFKNKFLQKILIGIVLVIAVGYIALEKYIESQIRVAVNHHKKQVPMLSIEGIGFQLWSQNVILKNVKIPELSIEKAYISAKDLQKEIPTELNIVAYGTTILKNFTDSMSEKRKSQKDIASIPHAIKIQLKYEYSREEDLLKKAQIYIEAGKLKVMLSIQLFNVNKTIEELNKLITKINETGGSISSLEQLRTEYAFESVALLSALLRVKPRNITLKLQSNTKDLSGILKSQGILEDEEALKTLALRQVVNIETISRSSNRLNQAAKQNTDNLVAFLKNLDSTIEFVAVPNSLSAIAIAGGSVPQLTNQQSINDFVDILNLKIKQY